MDFGTRHGGAVTAWVQLRCPAMAPVPSCPAEAIPLHDSAAPTVDLAEAEEFLRLHHSENPELGPVEYRLAEMHAEVAATGTYRHLGDPPAGAQTVDPTLDDGSTRTFLEDGDTVILRGRCERAGFRMEAALGDYDGRPWDLRADVWILVARKA